MRLAGGIVLATAAGQPDALRFRSLILTSTGAAAWRETGRSQQASGAVDRIAARDVTGKRRILHTAPYKTISSLKLLRCKIALWSAGAPNIPAAASTSSGANGAVVASAGI